MFKCFKISNSSRHQMLVIADSVERAVDIAMNCGLVRKRHRARVQNATLYFLSVDSDNAHEILDNKIEGHVCWSGQSISVQQMIDHMKHGNPLPETRSGWRFIEYH